MEQQTSNNQNKNIYPSVQSSQIKPTSHSNITDSAVEYPQTSSNPVIKILIALIVLVIIVETVGGYYLYNKTHKNVAGNNQLSFATPTQTPALSATPTATVGITNDISNWKTFALPESIASFKAPSDYANDTSRKNNNPEVSEVIASKTIVNNKISIKLGVIYVSSGSPSNITALKNSIQNSPTGGYENITKSDITVAGKEALLMTNMNTPAVSGDPNAGTIYSVAYFYNSSYLYTLALESVIPSEASKYMDLFRQVLGTVQLKN